MTGVAGFWDPHLPADPADSGFDWVAAKRELYGDVIDPTTPAMVRVWHALCGGKDCLPVDSHFGDFAQQVSPQLVQAAFDRLAFRARVTRALVGACGVGQLLVAGTDLPLMCDEVHTVAQQVDPTTRVVYADADPIVVLMAEVQLHSPWVDTCGYIEAGPGDPEAMLAAALTVLDPAEPVGVLLINSLDCLEEAAAAHAMEVMRARLPHGSYIAVCQLTGQTSQRMARLGTLQDRPIPGLPRPRTPADVTALFTGEFEVVAPGIVPASRWRPDPSPSLTESSGGGPADLWCGVGRICGPRRKRGPRR